MMQVMMCPTFYGLQNYKKLTKETSLIPKTQYAKEIPSNANPICFLNLIITPYTRISQVFAMHEQDFNHTDLEVVKTNSFVTHTRKEKTFDEGIPFLYSSSSVHVLHMGIHCWIMHFDL